MCNMRYYGYLLCRHAEPAATPLDPNPGNIAQESGHNCDVFTNYEMFVYFDYYNSDMYSPCRAELTRLSAMWHDMRLDWSNLLSGVSENAEARCLLLEINSSFNATVERTRREMRMGPGNNWLQRLREEISKLVEEIGLRVERLCEGVEGLVGDQE
jgi:hypothetical protein